jgi:hypothetical protein
MDYTLAIYNQPEMDRLSIDATVKKLVARGYPEPILRSIASRRLPVRGLLIDKRYGNVLKMDRFKVVHKGYHGLRELTREEIRSLYHQKKIRPATPRYHWVDTLYALSEVTLYAAVDRPASTAGRARRLRQALRRHPRVHRRGPPRRHHPRRGRLEPAPLHRARPPARADAPQAPQRREEAVRAHELALALHREDDDVPARRRDARVPELPSFLRRHRRRLGQARLLPGAPPLYVRESAPARLVVRRAGPVNGAHHPQGELRVAAPPLERGCVYEGGNLPDFEKFLGTTATHPLRRRPHLRRHPPLQEGERVAHRDDHPGDGGRGLRARVLPRGATPARRLRGTPRAARGRAALLPAVLQGHRPPPGGGEGDEVAGGLPRGRSGPDQARGRAHPRPDARHLRRDAPPGARHLEALPPLLGLAPQGGQRDVELRRPGRGIRLPLHHPACPTSTSIPPSSSSAAPAT